MTMSYSIDLSKSLSENVKAIGDIVSEEMRQFDLSNSPNIQQRLEISTTDFHLLVRMQNSFTVSGMDMLKKFHPEVQIVPKGNYDDALISAKHSQWKRHPSFIAGEDMQRTLAKWQLQAKGILR